MKKLLMAAVAVSALAAMPALAQTSQDYTFSGNVATSCYISGATTVDFGTLQSASGVYGPANGATVSATDTSAFCNQAQTTALVTHTNLKTTSPVSSGFTNLVVMSAKASTPQNATGVSDSTPAGTGTSAGNSGTLGAFTGLTVAATLTAPTDKLVAGTYSGTITVALTPAP